MSQTMSNEIQTIHYCTILSAGQWDFLLEGRFSPLRQKCLYRLMNGAVRTRTAYRIKGIDIVLEVGQPESEFLLRLDDDGNVGLFEADGGMWQQTAKASITAYFEDKLAEEVKDGKIVVMM